MTITVKTSSWFAPLPAGHIRIGISRGIPKGERDEDILTYRALAPGPWFKSVSPAEYQKRFAEQLAELDANLVIKRLRQLAGPGNVPVLACFEHARDIDGGRCWCHRHLVAQWLEQRLGITVEELEWPQLDRFRFLRDPQPWLEPPRKGRAAPRKAKPKKRAQLDLF